MYLNIGVIDFFSINCSRMHNVSKFHPNICSPYILVEFI